MNIFKSIIWNFHPYQHLKKYFGDDIGFSLIYSLASSGVQACVQIASWVNNKFDLNMSKVFVYFILVCLTYFCLDERVAMKTILYQNLAEVKMDWSIGFTRSWIRIVDNLLPFYFVKFLWGGTFMLIPGAKLVCLNRCRM